MPLPDFFKALIRYSLVIGIPAIVGVSLLQMSFINPEGASAANQISVLLWLVAIALGVVALSLWSVLRKLMISLREYTAAADRLASGDTSRVSELPAEMPFPEMASALKSLAATRDQGNASAVGTVVPADNPAQLSVVLEAMEEGVIVVDERERILLANKAALRLLELNPQASIGRPVWEELRIPKLQEIVEATRSDGEQRRGQIEVPRTSSILATVVSRLPMTTTGTDVTAVSVNHDPTRTSGVVVVLQDVTEIRRLENMRREFVSNVSHELKTPLAAISAYAETLLDGGLEDARINREFVSRIGEQAERLHNLILELLELARMESQDQVLQTVPLEIGPLLQTCATKQQKVAASKGLQLTVVAPPEPVWGLAEADGLQSIVDNLLANAINYTSPGGTIGLRWRSEADWIVIDVQDTGVGIAKEHQARIFERFFRVDKARSREVGGTGLGLSIVKHLCQAFGGTVSVTSQLGVGSTFTVKLIRADVPRV